MSESMEPKEAPDPGARSEGEPVGDSRVIRVRLVMPDRWLEHVEELPLATSVAEAKRIGLQALLLRDTDDPADFYTEYAEKKIRDESITLDKLGIGASEILSIRAYDLGHHPRFLG